MNGSGGESFERFEDASPSSDVPYCLIISRCAAASFLFGVADCGDYCEEVNAGWLLESFDEELRLVEFRWWSRVLLVEGKR